MNNNSKILMAIGIVLILLALFYVFYTRQKGSAPQLPAATTESLISEPSPTLSTEATSEATLSGQSKVITLSQQNNSKESGTATLQEIDGKVKVTLSLTGVATDSAQPAHIHSGACPDVGAVKYPLTSLLKGKSETILDVSMADLLKQLPLAINVHKSLPEVATYVSCGDIK